MDAPLQLQLELNEAARSKGVHFISTSTRGLFGYTFCDFGDAFQVIDTSGEPPLTGIITAVDQSSEGVVTCYDEARHGLDDGDYVTFEEIKGMTPLNGCTPRKVRVLGPYTFSIGDTSSLPRYEGGGIFTQVKQPKILPFQSLRATLPSPETLISDFAKFDRPLQLHLGFQALDAFIHQGPEQALPRPHHPEDAQKVIDLAKALIPSLTEDLQADGSFKIDEDLIRSLAYGARGDLAPMAAVLGGLTAQEVLKAVTGKFMPIHQYFYFDSLESLPPQQEKDASAYQATGTRYDGQVAVFGQAFQEQITNHRQFLVGSGAIGCEMLKNWAMMGLGTGMEGSVQVTDMDTIEKSNLNRQFLFRSGDVGQLKSECAIRAVQSMNPQTQGHYRARQDRVGKETENVYDDAFFDKIDGVTNALDNVEARRYMDERCIYYGKPLLESGTLGTKGNTQVVIPNLTESYSSSQDPPEKSFPSCTLKNFPNQIEHTIQWARDLFQGYFYNPAEQANAYLAEGDAYIRTLVSQGGGVVETLKGISDSLGSERPSDYDACLAWARQQFEDVYGNAIRQLLYNFPLDAVTSTGAPFWSGPKRAPTPLTFDPEDETHLDFVMAGANLRASMYGIPPVPFTQTGKAKAKAVLGSVKVKGFEPIQGLKINVDEKKEDPAPGSGPPDDEAEVDQVIQSLPSPSSLGKDYRLIPVEFEKDDDTNWHMDFITAASNLRASNYSIQPASRHKTKLIAGKIIPAIATTTSLVTGLVCLEMYKIIGGHKDLGKFKNGFVNLALPFIGFSEPVAAPKLKYNDTEFTLWDFIDITEPVNPTLEQLINILRDKYELDLTMLVVDGMMLYGFFMPKKKQTERLGSTILELIHQIGKRELPSHVRYATGEVCVYDKEGEDVDVPQVRIRVRE